MNFNFINMFSTKWMSCIAYYTVEVRLSGTRLTGKFD